MSGHKKICRKKSIAAIAVIIFIAAALFVIFSVLKSEEVRLASVNNIPPAVTGTSEETGDPVVTTTSTAPSVTISPVASEMPEAPTEEVSAEPSAAPSPSPSPSPSPTVKEEQPPLLTEMLNKFGYTIDDISSSQLLMLANKPSGSKLYLYDKDSAGLWSLYTSFSANVGKNGVTDKKTEGDKKTPLGFYAMGLAFGNEPMPDTKWTYRKVTTDSYWVDDPKSAYYNTWVEGKAKKDWNSAEHLSEETKAYAYAMVIEYNTDPIVPGKGSAIFLHCGTNPTVGCVSVERSNMLKILKWLKAKSNAHILIASAG